MKKLIRHIRHKLTKGNKNTKKKASSKKVHHRGPYTKPPRLEKVNHNPILSPLEHSAWESWQTFNPAAIEIDNIVYLFYRAI